MRLAGALRGICIVALAMLFPVGMPPSVRGGTGTIFSLPVGPKATVNGLALSVDCQWVMADGYTPVRIDITCTPPAAMDRTLNVEMGVANWPSRNRLTVATEIEIPSGTSRVSKLISVPAFSPAQFLSLDVWEDGLHLDRLSVENRSINAGLSGGYWGVETDHPRILFVSSKPVDITELHFLTVETGYPVRSLAASASIRVAQAATLMERPAADLMENWINYSGLDLIFISLGDVQDLAIFRPRDWQALCKWTWSGGNLCVYGVGDDWHGLATLEPLLACPASDEQSQESYRGWQQPPRELFDQPLALAGANSGLNVDAAGNPLNAPRTKPTPPETNPFVWKQAVLGQVVAIASEQPFPGEEIQWKWMFNAIDPARWKWRYRHGVSASGDNPAFDNFLIADIGLPPIRTYRVLITLFVIVIGPLNYWLLRRKGRLHLLLFTVPAAALLTSGLLIGYALAADGFEARLRARSYTRLDQRRHEAVSWARLSYYTGLSPSEGLRFPGDTVVIPLEKFSSTEAFSGRRRQMTWTDQQHLARGWLGSRTPTQYITLRAYSSPRELTILPTDDGQRRTVKNQLGVKIKHLILCDEGGKLHSGKQIGVADQVALRPLDSDGAREVATVEVLGAVYRDPLLLPAQMASNRQRGFFASIRNVGMPWGNRVDSVDSSTSLLEVELAGVRAMLSSATFEPRTYVAIVERPVEIVVGMDGLTESQSLHVILGTW
jgi:hypothetical protein